MEPTEADLDRIGASLRKALTNESSGINQIDRARTSVLEEFALRGAQGRGVLRWRLGRRSLWLLILTGSVAAAVAAFAVFSRPASFQWGDSRPGQLGDLIESAGGHDTPVQFSEGSRVVLHDGGRMRVLSFSTGRARVLVESGVLDVSVARSQTRKTRWTFEAGDYLVTVTGTRFQMAYSAQKRSFRVATEEGQVWVSGGCQHITRSVSAGEEITLSCPTVEDTAEGPSSVGDATDDPGEPSVAAAFAVPAWRRLLAAGRLAEGLRAAQRDDFRHVCRMATSRELLALADAARLFGSSRHAVIALQSLRQRFAETVDASTAAYRLGLMAFEKDRSYVQAAQWFEIYLRDQPSGPLIGDAFGRIMQARSRAGDGAGARESAQQYLLRFPKGPYAREALGILSR